MSENAVMDIEFIDQQQLLTFDFSHLQQLAASVLAAHQITQAEIHVLLVDNPTIHAMNVAHLEHDFPTDVITFPLNDTDQQPPDYPLEAEIVISTEMAAEMAGEAGWSAEEEATLYLVHSLLHLCGFDDLTEDAQREMRQRELEMLHHLGMKPSETDTRFQGL
ncbi:rRNA maturation RNase YbeY [Rubinisphaera brasiliensis]|uniref:Endoribonuclease YbeY n=1 Tax=Rubinisphaera brasiliensis (strain ATCC 49424 / DSM 5305 / JCM 21570 / IAM 15109 / NBRC 103401 / IFAM 1448) TaxID=756272 RepID=F0SRT7_RUBBR|nr:rRNA maturation RNase YbeY [Rubinisphaera brasiliensis]ADY60253.1 metalloprotease ybeY [Rubinisphaera brasiliensis DSM 5305]